MRDVFSSFGILVGLCIGVSLLFFGFGYLISELKELYINFKWNHESIGKRDIGIKIVRDSYWFSEDLNTMTALRILGRTISENGSEYRVENVRDKWLESIKEKE